MLGCVYAVSFMCSNVAKDCKQGMQKRLYDLCRAAVISLSLPQQLSVLGGVGLGLMCVVTSSCHELPRDQTHSFPEACFVACLSQLLLSVCYINLPHFQPTSCYMLPPSLPSPPRPFPLPYLCHSLPTFPLHPYLSPSLLSSPHPLICPSVLLSPPPFYPPQGPVGVLLLFDNLFQSIVILFLLLLATPFISTIEQRPQSEKQLHSWFLCDIVYRNIFGGRACFCNSC